MNARKTWVVVNFVCALGFFAIIGWTAAGFFDSVFCAFLAGACAQTSIGDLIRAFDAVLILFLLLVLILVPGDLLGLIRLWKRTDAVESERALARNLLLAAASAVAWVLLLLAILIFHRLPMQHVEPVATLVR